MSKYDALWAHVRAQSGDALTLSFDEIEQIAGVTVDHSLLRYKKELKGCGWRVEKISLKNRTIRFAKED